MDDGGHRGICVEGSVGDQAFLLEVPPAALQRVGRCLDLADEPDGELEHRVRDLLCAEACALAATPLDEEGWRVQGFQWDALERRWQRAYTWSRLEPLLAAAGLAPGTRGAPGSTAQPAGTARRDAAVA